MTPLFLGLEEIICIHDDQLARYGGAPGLRDPGLLQSALQTPQAGVSGGYLHDDLYEMAAAYLFHIVQNHPFIDGNKRVAAVSALVFLKLNGVEIVAANDALVEMVLNVATGGMSKVGVAEFLRRHAKEQGGR